MERKQVPSLPAGIPWCDAYGVEWSGQQEVETKLACCEGFGDGEDVLLP